MKKKRLGWTDLELTRIGLGTFAIGGPDWRGGWGPQNDNDSIQAIRRALELGINWIDTAPVYGLGQSEEIVRTALKGTPTKPIIATKCGLAWDDDRNIIHRLKRESVLNEVDASLNRLGIDIIDLYQIHWPNPDEDLEEAWSAMAEAVKAGKVRYIGVSNCNVDQLERLRGIHRIASLQPPYSMILREVQEKILPYCEQHEIGVIPYSPMQRGLLTGKYTIDTVRKLDKRDHRLQEPYFQEPALSIHLSFVERLRPIAEKNGKTLAQLAIAWVLRRPEVTAAIVGARRPSQIEETAATADWDIGEDIQRIDKIIEEWQAELEANLS